MSRWISDLLDFAKFTANSKSFSHFVHSILGFRLTWWCFNKCVDKFSECHDVSPTCLTSQSLPQTQNFFFYIMCPPCWVSDLLDFTKYTWDSLFSPQTNNHSIFLFFSPQKLHITRDRFKIQCLKWFSPLFS